MRKSRRAFLSISDEQAPAFRCGAQSWSSAACRCAPPTARIRRRCSARCAPSCATAACAASTKAPACALLARRARRLPTSPDVGARSTTCREVPGNCCWFLTCVARSTRSLDTSPRARTHSHTQLRNRVALARQPQAGHGERRGARAQDVGGACVRRVASGDAPTERRAQVIVAGGSAGVMYWAVPFPFDTGKRRAPCAATAAHAARRSQERAPDDRRQVALAAHRLATHSRHTRHRRSVSLSVCVCVILSPLSSSSLLRLALCR